MKKSIKGEFQEKLRKGKDIRGCYNTFKDSKKERNRDKQQIKEEGKWGIYIKEGFKKEKSKI